MDTLYTYNKKYSQKKNISMEVHGVRLEGKQNQQLRVILRLIFTNVPAACCVIYIWR